MHKTSPDRVQFGAIVDRDLAVRLRLIAALRRQTLGELVADMAKPYLASVEINYKPQPRQPHKDSATA